MSHMIKFLAKSLGWIITSVIGLTVALTAIVLNKSASGGAIGIHLPISPPHWPPSHSPPPAVPEVNTGLVLLPIVFAVLLFASRQLLRKRA